MQYMILFFESEEEWAKRNDPDAAPGYWKSWMDYVGEMQAAGIVVNGDGLEPPETATQVQVRDGKRQLHDGPFPDTREHLGGYFTVEVDSLDVALDWAAKAPSVHTGTTEVRPVMPPPPQ